MNLAAVCLMTLSHPSVELAVQGAAVIREADRLIRRVEAQRAELRKGLADDIAEWERMRQEIEVIDEGLKNRRRPERP